MLRRGVVLVLFGLCLACGAPSFAAEAVAPPPLPADNPTPPPLPPPEPAAQFFAAENGQPVGPMSLEQLNARVQNNQTKRGDLVWKSGTPDWVKAEELAELRDAFGAAPPDVPQAAKWQQFLLGVWEASGKSPQGYDWTLQISYTADGKYGGVQLLTYNGLTDQQPLSGQWSVTPAGENKFSLTLSPLGSRPVTSVLIVIDQNTLHNEQEGFYARRIQ